jgi:hypothetical protein
MRRPYEDTGRRVKGGFETRPCVLPRRGGWQAAGRMAISSSGPAAVGLQA